MKRLSIEQVKSGMVSAVDLFPPNNNMLPYIRQGTIFTDSIIYEAARIGITSVYVQSPDEPASHPPPTSRPHPAQPTYTPEIVKPPPGNSKNEAVIVPEPVKKQALSSLEDLYHMAEIGKEDIHESSKQVIKQVDNVVVDLVDSLSIQQGMLVNITDLKSYDEYTYHHSLSVAVLSIAIGQHLGFSKQRQRQIGLTAMMHDIGKTAVPLEIINKTSRLDDDEFAIIKSHSPAGYDYLKKTAIKDDELLKGVLYHHEKLDGTGYPHGISGDQIPLFSKIISVADVYDALTSNRPYRIPMQPGEAIEYLLGNVDNSFEFEIVDAFTKKVELYPVGSRILLSNSRSAVVLKNEHPMRPTIQLVDTGEIIDLARDRRYLSVVVASLLPKISV